MLTIKPGQVMNLTRYILPSQRVKLIFSTKLWSGALLFFFFLLSRSCWKKRGLLNDLCFCAYFLPLLLTYFTFFFTYCTSVNMCYPLLFTRWGLQSCNLSFCILMIIAIPGKLILMKEKSRTNKEHPCKWGPDAILFVVSVQKTWLFVL